MKKFLINLLVVLSAFLGVAIINAIFVDPDATDEAATTTRQTTTTEAATTIRRTTTTERPTTTRRTTTRALIWPSTTPSTRPARTTTTTDPELENLAYLIAVRQQTSTGWVARATDDNLLLAGATICVARGTGTSFLDISLELLTIGIDGDGIGMDPESIGALIGGGVRRFCPEYLADMIEFMESIS